MTENKQKPTIFISYSHKDDDLKKQISEHLKVTANNYDFNVWDDEKIRTGDKWNTEIEHAIDRSQMAVLLISVNFLSSEFINDKELPYILERQGMRIYPIILSDCDWKGYTCQDFSIEETQAKPSGGKPLSKFKGRNRESVIVEIVNDMKNILLECVVQPEDKTASETVTQKDDTKFASKYTPFYCNRDSYVDSFTIFYKQKLKQCQKTPQFYFLHGAPEECPYSLIQRLNFNEIYRFLKENKETFRPKIKGPIELPEKRSNIDSKASLREKLFLAINNDYSSDTDKLEAFYQLKEFEHQENNVYILFHTLTIKQWDQELMEWYIADYWHNADCVFDNGPMFLLFFSIDASDNNGKKRFWRNPQKRLQKKLKKLSQYLDHKQCFHLIFDQLHHIEPYHVRNWFLKYHQLPDSEINDHISNIFKENQTVNMATVEKYLIKIWNDMKKKKGENYVYSQA
jgi:hypothetical protein